jgi:CBS domain-containing protein
MNHQLKDLMSRDVKVISPDMTIEEAARTMRDGDFGMLPVGEDDTVIRPAAEALAQISEPS